MELLALMKALEEFPDQHLDIISDSKYVVEGFKKLGLWKKKNFKTNKYRMISNHVIWKRISELSVGREVKIVHVKAHSGVELNEKADREARRVRESYSE
jgi:ribonuclease HI